VGSFKAVIGHTKATAGAASLLRAVLALNHGEMPPMPGEHPPPAVEAGAPVILDRALALADPKQRIGVSSFGFGGINVHVVLASAEAVHREAGSSLGKRPQTAGILVGTAIRRIDDSLRTDPVLDQLRVAPAIRAQIDEAQLAALVAVQAVLDEVGLDLERVEPDKVAVVSASVTALGAATRLSHRMRYRELEALVPAEVESVRKALARSRDELAPLTEDSGPGILNNVIAGRVANTFNLTGPSFNVDADLASAGLAHWVATNLLGPSCRLVLLIDVHERWNSDKNRVERDSVEVKLLATEEATWEFGLPRLRLLAEVEHVA
jgi:3-oxoacyl-(acyl-carrier-protein) synthase